MRALKTSVLIAAMGFGVGINQAHAAGMIWLEPATQNVMLGNQTALDLWVDFSGEKALGGGVDIFYDDTRLNYVNTVFNTAVFNPAIPTFDLRLPDTAHAANELHGLSFGDSIFGISGPYAVATLTFDTTNVGAAMVSVQEATDPLTGGQFVSFVTNAPFTTAPTFDGATVNVVPELETWAMMAAGIGFLSWKMRRRQDGKTKELASS